MRPRGNDQARGILSNKEIGEKSQMQKKIFTYLAALMLVVCTGGLSTAQGSDITIYDNMNNWDFSQAPGGCS